MGEVPVTGWREADAHRRRLRPSPRRLDVGGPVGLTFVAAAVVCLALSACAPPPLPAAPPLGPSPVETVDTVERTTRENAPVPSAPSADGLKAPVGGFVDRQGNLDDRWAGIIRGIVVNIGWDEVQTSGGGEILTANPIDAALDEVRAFNTRNPAAPVAIKLRVTAGVNAPEWLKQEVGAAFADNPAGEGAGEVPYWWRPEVDRAYRDLMQKLASRYDHVAEIREVQITRCSLIYPEPFIRMRSENDAMVAFKANGLTRSSDLACLRASIDAHRVWRTTRSALALNPYQDPDGKGGDVATTLEIAAECRQVLGARCLLENHSVRDGSQGPDYEEMYAAMTAMGRPLAIQTATPAKIGDLGRAISRAEDIGAEAIELPYDYKSWDPATFRATFAGTIGRLDPQVLHV